MKCEDYNKVALSNWNKAVDTDPKMVNNLSCFVWLNNKGDYKKYGYVGKTPRGVIWDIRKCDVVYRLKKEYNLEV